jgi:predicted glycogen debranching enzyme
MTDLQAITMAKKAIDPRLLGGSPHVDEATEWLEPDGLGGFASGTTSLVRTRRYQGLLLSASHPPSDRTMLVNGVIVYADTPRGTFALSADRYAPDVTHPDCSTHIRRFTNDPWPAWTFDLGASSVTFEIAAVHGLPITVLRWRKTGDEPITLRVRPLLSVRDPHALARANDAFRFAPELSRDRVVWRPYDAAPGIVCAQNGTFVHAPDWYRNFLYVEERARGLDHLEDLASPGELRFALDAPATIAFARESDEALGALGEPDFVNRSLERERARRAAFPTRLHRAADAYVVARGSGRTIIAGYPWFGDWGRDTFLALRGLCFATGRMDVARDILLEWSGAVSEGMLPNRFPDRGDRPEYNSVDASLAYVIAAGEYLDRAAPSASVRSQLEAAMRAILDGYRRGTRHGIRADGDGLLRAGEPGVQLTWMDAKVGDWVVTPRIGKPVEVQALWINALAIGARSSPELSGLVDRATESFRARFWDEAHGRLFDVVDVDHRAGAVDASFRPNQVFAAGGLPRMLLPLDAARRVVDAVEARLWTPLGLRSLAPGEPSYARTYEGGVRERDGAYHQGTVWPWLIGPFADAWVRTHGNDDAARRTARERFVDPLLDHLDRAGVDHVSEIADAEPPYAPRGCPFQAWSVSELLRLTVELA